MKDRVLSWVLLFLCFAPILIAVIGVQFLPDQIPVHYNAAGEIDRWGSKYEQLIIGVAFSASGWILWLVSKFSHCFADTAEELAKAKANAKIVLAAGIAVQLLMSALQVMFVIGAYTEAQSGAAEAVMPIYKVMGIGVGLLYIVLGNIMPKAKPNNLVGVRTIWSYVSEAAWRKSQRAGGIAFAAAGAACIVLTLFLHGFVIFWVIMGATAAAAIASIYLSWKYSRE